MTTRIPDAGAVAAVRFPGDGSPHGRKKKKENTKDVTGDKHLPETWSWVDGGSCQILPQSSEGRKRK